MLNLKDRYHILYAVGAAITAGESTINIEPADIVSVSFMCQYDKYTYPIIRLRIYTDIENVLQITDNSEDIMVSLSLDGAKYKINTTDDGIQEIKLAGSGDSISLSMNAYIEMKNNQTSQYNLYDQGLKRSNDMNNQMKVPFELFLYNRNVVHSLRKKVPSIYKDMSLSTVIDTISSNCGVKIVYQGFDNGTKYDQVLIPNLNVLDALSFLDRKYGFYKKGAGVYVYNDTLYLYPLDVEAFMETRGNILVEDIDTVNDAGGMNVDSLFCTAAQNVSVKTVSDIDQVMNSEQIATVNLNTLNVDVGELKKLFRDTRKNKYTEYITTPDNLYKNVSAFNASALVARIEEGITSIDISGTGWPYSMFGANGLVRYTLGFDTPIRGLNMNDIYRPVFANYVLSNTGNTLFTPQITLRLCTN